MKNVSVGQKCFIEPTMTKAVDGNQYPVISVLAGGRGWFSQQFYVVDKDVKIEVEVKEIIEPNEWIKKRYAIVDFVENSGNVPVKIFKKKPYVSKKTGLHGPVVADEFNAYGDVPVLKGQYCSRIMTGSESNNTADMRYDGGKGLLIETKWLK